MATALPTGPHPSASLYVGDLVTDVTEAQLFEIFNAVGPVASVRVCRDAATRRSLGYAYVNFHRVEDAERALDTMNFKSIRMRPCRIMWSHRDPSLRKSGIGNIFVKNLAKAIDNKTLYDTFSMFGNILSCKVAQDLQRNSLGYGFVHYENEEASRNAIERVDGKVIAGQKVSVSRFLSKKERGGGNNATYTNVYIKNLPPDFTEEQLIEMCTKFGDITSQKIEMDKETGKSREFGFVNFGEADHAAAAVEALNGLDMGGEKKLYVSRAQKKDAREKELRDRFEHLKLERQKKYAGVNLYVKNLSDDIDDEKLRIEFAKFGAITSSRVMVDTATGKSKGFGFVCFSSPEEATKAVTEMNGHMLDAKPLYVALAQRKEVRRAQLEAQHQARSRAGVPQPQMYPGHGAPIFYQPVPQRNFMAYPQQVPRQFVPQGGQRMMLGGGQPAVGYQLMPVSGGRGGGQGGQGGRGGRQGGQGHRGGRQGGPNRGGQGGRGQPRPNQQQAYKFSENAQNVRQDRQPAAQAQAAPEPAETNQEAQPALTIQALAAAPEEQKKQMIGEQLFLLVQQAEPELAGKITGMLLEMDNGELIHLMESPDALKGKIEEAMSVLEAHQDTDE